MRSLFFVLKQLSRRILHLMARFLPGGTSLRIRLHRLRGVKINGRVWIGDEVYLENTYPECIELNDESLVLLRSVLLAHTMGGRGKVIVEKKARIGACCLVAASPGQTLIIGEGSMVAAGSVVRKNVPPYTFVAGVPAKPIATLKYPPTLSTKYDVFKSGMTRIDGTPPAG